MNKSNKKFTDEVLIKPTIFPFNVNPRDYDKADMFVKL